MRNGFGTTTITLPNDSLNRANDNDDTPKNPHNSVTFARVFANDLAKNEIFKEKPNFAVGSIIVREKLLKADDTAPEVVTVMVKRAKDFCKKCGNWEYFVLEGNLEKVQKQEKTGSCQKCHAQAHNTDYVFRNYIKQLKQN